MSRRKQSNPKSIKSENEEQTWCELNKESPENTDSFKPPTMDEADQKCAAIKHEDMTDESEDMANKTVAGKDTVSRSPQLSPISPSEKVGYNINKENHENVQSVATLVKLEDDQDVKSEELSDEESAMETEKEVAGINAPEFTTAVPHPLIFVCPDCGVRFSSPHTLQGHITYYCSKQRDISTETPCDDDANKSSPENVKRKKSLEPKEGEDIPGRKRSRQLSHDFSPEGASPSLSPGSEAERDNHKRQRTHSGSLAEPSTSGTRKQPPQFWYSIKEKNCVRSQKDSNKKTSKDGVTEDKNVEKRDNISPESNMYCAECKIQFSSRKTYQGHKEFYCSKRQKETSPDDFEDWRSQSSSDDHSQNNNNVLTPVIPSGPVLIPPGCISPSLQSVSAMTIPGSILAQPTVVFTGPLNSAPGAAGIALTMPTLIMHPLFLPGSMPGHLGLTSAVGMPPTEEKPLDLTMKKDNSETKTKDDDDTKSSSGSREDSHLIDNESPTDLSIKKSNKEGMSSDTNDRLNTKSRNAKSPGKISHGSTSNPHFIPSKIWPMIGTSGTVNLPHNISICSECNIVFYKHENFLIHKQFYCSGRKAKAQTSDESESEPTTSSENRGEHPLLVETAKQKSTDRESPMAKLSPTATPKECALQFSCTPCKIKFSSLSTLDAHQRYYCPFRPQIPKLGTQVSSPEVPIENQTSSEDSSTAMPHVCHKCGNEYPTIRLLKVHFCQVSNKQGIWNLLRCSQCSFVTHKESQFSDHMRKHSAVKGFRCSLCGYRGNTIRGMRMHGKMHVDKGETFTDDHMVVLDGEDLDGNDNLSSPVFSSDIESEIIRLKNEPYKRRRSRYKRRAEETHNLNRLTDSPKTDALFVCGMCNAPFSDCNDLGQHMQKHLETKPFRCSFCEYSSAVEAHVEKHERLIHKGETASASSEGESISPRVSISPCVEIKTEPIDSLDGSSIEKHVANIKREKRDSDEQTPKEEIDTVTSFPKIEPKLVVPFLKKVKNEPKEVQNKNENHCEGEPTNSQTPPQTVKMSSQSDSPIMEKVNEANNVSSVIVNGTGSPNFRYCNHCDISFMYLSSFVAHKKYYCNASMAEAITSEKKLVGEAK